jgi:hypothetical protein
MLEPLYLASDFLNLIGLSPLAAIPMRLANAMAPAFSSLVNIGYANVVQNADGTYTRDFTNAGTETPFLSFPDIDYSRVPGDVINQLIGGFTKEFFSNNPTPNTPNVLSNLLDALLGGRLGGVSPLAAQQAPAALTAASVPASDGKLLSLSASASEESAGVATTAADEKSAAATDSLKEPTAEKALATTTELPVAAEKPATEEVAADEKTTPPKHAKPDEDAKPATDTGTTTEKTPKHAKPSLNVVRDSPNASAPSDAKPGERTATTDSGKKDEAAAADGVSESGGASSGAAA